MRSDWGKMEGWRKRQHPGKDPRAPTAKWHRLDGEWVLLVSPAWEMIPGDTVSVPRRGARYRQLIQLGEFVCNTGPSEQSWRDYKDAFQPGGRVQKHVVRADRTAAGRKIEEREDEDVEEPGPPGTGPGRS